MWAAEHRDAALASPELASEHKEFLAALELDEHGYPFWGDKWAGIGGVYHLRPQ